jgi:hypothetical protein
MDCLALLASCIEEEGGAIAPALADPVERRQLERLQQIGALVPSRARTIICPRCEAHSVRVITAGSALCVGCGKVVLAAQDLQRLSPDGEWLRRRIAQALDLAGESAWVTVPGRVWRIGDIGRASERHRVLFGQQLADVMVQRALLSVWATHVGDISTTMITTTSIDRVFLPGVRVRLVPLAAAFRVRGDGLVADEPVWAGVRAAVPTIAGQARHGPFALDYRDVLLAGESDPIPLTRSQAALLRVLWEQAGVSIGGPLLIRMAGLELEKPIDAFPLNKYPEANRAYRALVSSDRRGQYCISRNATDSGF